MKVLVFNCGSSSIKYKLYDMPENLLLASGSVSMIGGEKSVALQKANSTTMSNTRRIADHEEGFSAITGMLTDKENGAVASLSEIGACGHRVVYGTEKFPGPVIIDAEVEDSIERYADLAPIHNPVILAGIRLAKKIFPVVPQVACFDTSFHATIPEIAYRYALPSSMFEKYGIRKYGFHGTSHQYVARRAAELLNKGAHDVDLVICHLGNGCSITAVKRGKSVDTSMGLTPLEGLVMGTRSGDFDPAIIFYLLKKGYTPIELEDVVNKKSGLLGISELSNNVRDLEEKAQEGNAGAKLALDIFAYRLKKYIGSYLAVLNGADAVVFCGGIGENGPHMRARALGGMETLGIKLDVAKNDRLVGKEGEIQAVDSKIKLFVIPTDEESCIAGDTYALAIGKAARP